MHCLSVSFSRTHSHLVCEWYGSCGIKTTTSTGWKQWPFIKVSFICSHLNNNHMLIAIALWTKNSDTRRNYSHKLCGWFPDGYLYVVFLSQSIRELLFIFCLKWCSFFLFLSVSFWVPVQHNNIYEIVRQWFSLCCIFRTLCQRNEIGSTNYILKSMEMHRRITFERSDWAQV